MFFGFSTWMMNSAAVDPDTDADGTVDEEFAPFPVQEAATSTAGTNRAPRSVRIASTVVSIMPPAACL
jgi:hypothetical protein